jgi:penicillin-binding protein 2
MPDREEDETSKRGFARRALLIGAAQAGAFALLGGRLYQLQLMQGRRFGPLAEENRISQRGIVPRRGRILDRAGRVLASNKESFRVSILPGDRSRMRRSLQTLARIIPLSEEEIERVVAKAKGWPRNRPILVRQGLAFEEAAKIGLLATALPGVETELDMQRTYAYGHASGHVVGHVGSVERYALDDDPFLKLPGARIGKTGVELGMEGDLRGEAGSRRFEVDARGRVVRNLDETDPVAGRDVVLTIDTSLQARVLARIAAEPRAAVVSLDVRSGEVVVMASVPTFDPNDLTANFDEAVWERLQADPHKPLLNRAIAGLYPPGSTFKMVTALAALEAGAVTLDEAVTCRGVYHFADQSYRCWKREGHGRVGLEDAIRESCDVYFYDLAERIGINRIAVMARRLGLGQTYACGIAGQKDGLIPDTDWKRATLGKTWLRGETILAGIGQGYVLTTPLQLAVMTARLATGRAVVPTLVRKPGAVLPEGPLFPALGISTDGLEAVRRAMVGVVNEAGGTGSNASLAGRAVVIAGKTGTSQVRTSPSGRKSAGEDAFEHRDHALFVSYFPAGAPRYAVAAVVEHGGGGGAAAAPIVRDVIAMLLEDDPAARASLDGGSSP